MLLYCHGDALSAELSGGSLDIEDKLTGAPRAKVTMRPGDVASMPADIRHQGYSRKRSMLLVWENANPDLPALYASGKLPPYPIEF